MNTKESSIEDIKVIRQMMENSSKFLSLSGLSGIAAGTFAIIGAAIAYFYIMDAGNTIYDEYLVALKGGNTTNIRMGLLFDALFVLTGAIASAWYFSWRKSKNKQTKFWTPSTKKMAWSLSFVLLIGGLFSLILAYHENIRLVGAAMLIFYGLALINAAKYTHRDIQYLGYIEVALGLLAGIFLNYGLLFWTLGFGVFHIVYGVTMYYKYDREKQQI
ncbi:hypothetical protein DMA11_13525 [Marinilabiliaceae bacterium JC017]|nr:hypothetical protein DMA11_13525 [Marinilabiliaceae bacterium JC017]